eukprot:CAMPEP_0198111264 /NCGR_PEP_ID=MMETSP1442-20131203/3233_1 /TAXON_ID= /ORGANISM="Craspedostauros australis, Strain CCMP3328" /LENGTH=422 /DNA_ID=CAMNT_0043767641 /DNA_START=155 /DNA_END=1423 /DNA_ORIENTATION=-
MARSNGDDASLTSSLGSSVSKPKKRRERKGKIAAGVAEREGESASAGPLTLSVLNLVLLVVTLVGLGALCGFYLFYTMFTHRCSDLVDDMERHHNATHRELEDKYIGALEEKHKCIEDETRKQEIAELKGRLEGQSSLFVNHQQLLEKHQTTLEQYTSLHKDHEEMIRKFEVSQNDAHFKQKEIAVLQRNVDERAQELDEAERRLAHKLELSNKMVQNKVEENAALKQARDTCRAESKITEWTTKQMQSSIQNQSRVKCEARYGSDPYALEFSMRFPSGEHRNMMVQIANMDALPHSAWAFMESVEDGLYNNGSFVASNGNVLEIAVSDPSNAAAALFFAETSKQAPCRRGSINFRENGPALQLHLRDSSDEDSCFGKVVSGLELAEDIEAWLSNEGRHVDLMEVRRLREDDEGGSQGGDEL